MRSTMRPAPAPRPAPKPRPKIPLKLTPFTGRVEEKLPGTQRLAVVSAARGAGGRGRFVDPDQPASAARRRTSDGAVDG